MGTLVIPPGKLFLVPAPLGPAGAMEVLSPWVKQQVNHLKMFIVESEKAGRAAIRCLQLATPQSGLELFLLNEHTPMAEREQLVQPLLAGNDVGLLSDAGLPCVADPGADVVAVAQRKGIEVVPLPGPSSLLLALMASGFNGQGFAFQGYLPVERPQRIKRLKELEREARQRRQTQLFIETPYRNNHVLQDILTHCQPDTRLCVAVNLTQPGQHIRTRTVAQWKKEAPVDLHKQPAVFLLASHT